MIQAFIFDLDGTLVKTERLKAISYAQAAVELRPDIEEAAVLEAFKDVVGQSRRGVAQHLLGRFGLADAAKLQMEEFGVPTPWQAYVQIRLRHYHQMIDDPDILLANRWPHTNDLLDQAKGMNCTVALATMSRCRQAKQVLEILELNDVFSFVATRDDVENAKPDPEIYELVARELDVNPAHCVVVEDSTSGVQAALAAGMNVVAVATPFTRDLLHAADLVPSSHIADEPAQLAQVVEHVASHIPE